MGNNLSERKREKEKCVGIQKKLDEEEKLSQNTVTILIMGQGTVNFLNALQCIRDGGIDDNTRLQCKAYIYHQMIFEMKSLIKKTNDGMAGQKEWSNKLFKHCVTDSLLIYGFIKSFMVYDREKRRYSISDRRVVWNIADSAGYPGKVSIKKNNKNENKNENKNKNNKNKSNKNKNTDYVMPILSQDNSNSVENALLSLSNENNISSNEFTNYDNRVYVSSQIMSTIIGYYQSHDTVQQWLNILFFQRNTIQNRSVINHYILNNVNIGQFIIDIFNEFNAEQQNKLLTHYDIGVVHYFSNLQRICSSDCIPTHKDIIICSKSIGFSAKRKSKTKYHMRNSANELKDLIFLRSMYHFTNIQPMFRTAVKRWICQFEDKCDGLIFLIPLTTYYKWDSKWDTFNLVKNFQTITNNNWLKQSSFHLFLTGKELFKSKLKEAPFTFSNYNGNSSDYDQCIQFLISYLKSKLIADNKGDKRQIYIHVVSLYHLDQIRETFGEIHTILAKTNTNDTKHQQMSSQKFQL